MPMDKPEISVVIPVFNEVGNVETLAKEIKDALDSCGRSFELIYVDDGSTDGTPDACQKIGWVRCIVLAKNAGQSAATITGIHAAKADIIVTLDGDRQNDPASIPDLLEALNDSDAAQAIRKNATTNLTDAWPVVSPMSFAICFCVIESMTLAVVCVPFHVTLG